MLLFVLFEKKELQIYYIYLYLHKSFKIKYEAAFFIKLKIKIINLSDFLIKLKKYSNQEYVRLEIISK